MIDTKEDFDSLCKDAAKALQRLIKVESELDKLRATANAKADEHRQALAEYEALAAQVMTGQMAIHIPPESKRESLERHSLIVDGISVASPQALKEATKGKAK
jgi:hypothetical protein